MIFRLVRGWHLPLAFADGSDLSLQSSLQALTTYDGVLHAALCHGVAIFVLASVFGHISGGHVNPAVTIGIAAAGKLPPLDAVLYIIAQLLGGVLGSLMVRVLLSYDQYVAIQGGATLVGSDVMWYQALIAEILTTYLLMQTILMTAVDESTVLAPLAIGFTLIIDILAAGSISGASMNPGRSFGPNIVATIFMQDKLADRFWSKPLDILPWPIARCSTSCWHV
ncbi:hypothetical protein KIN20_020532 [Parelaphostrongylus tenuis]|uniref:Uncharacterized protein n=1 Tax=Parelaphostrongylus tenuis TaxID=148309 RepID=A0AAD5QTK2_PARTN|nr:hypothetical protein KIN20_020532 [Parelaphostrongylus tenuis]